MHVYIPQQQNAYCVCVCVRSMECLVCIGIPLLSSASLSLIVVLFAPVTANPMCIFTSHCVHYTCACQLCTGLSPPTCCYHAAQILSGCRAIVTLPAFVMLCPFQYQPSLPLSYCLTTVIVLYYCYAALPPMLLCHCYVAFPSMLPASLMLLCHALSCFLSLSGC